MVASPAASWLFFKARAKRPYLSHTGRASNAEKQPTGHGPEGCDENGPAAALLVGYVSIQICALLAPCRRPILIATKAMLFMGQDTSQKPTDNPLILPRRPGTFELFSRLPQQVDAGRAVVYSKGQTPDSRARIVCQSLAD